MTKLSSVPSEDITSIVLFGSVARGDADQHSDRDYCLFTKNVDFPTLVDLRTSAATELGVSTPSVCAYPISIAAAMCDLGSLFLWHLRLEGRILYDRQDYAHNLLLTLQPFAGHVEELALFQELINDVQASLERFGDLTEFDLHVLQSVVRDTCILLTHWASRPTFGRISSAHVAMQEWPGLRLDLGDYEELCAWHLHYARGVGQVPKHPDHSRLVGLLDSVNKIIEFARNVFK